MLLCMYSEFFRGVANAEMFSPVLIHSVSKSICLD